MSGSSNSEPGSMPRAVSGRTIGPTFCGSNYGGLLARRHGSERVRRKITVIQEGDPDMTTMPDDAELRALHETLHPDDYEYDPRAYAPETSLYSGPQEVSHGNHFTASIDNSVANGNELHRLVHAPEGVLPSDLVRCPAACMPPCALSCWRCWVPTS